MKIRKSIQETEPLLLPVANHFTFCLEFESHRTVASPRNGLPIRRSHPNTKGVTGITSPYRSQIRGRYVPGRPSTRDICNTCKLFRPSMFSSSYSKATSFKNPLNAPATTLRTLESMGGCDRCTMISKGIRSYLPYYKGQETGVIYFTGNEMLFSCVVELKSGLSPVLEYFSDDSKFI